MSFGLIRVVYNVFQARLEFSSVSFYFVDILKTLTHLASEIVFRKLILTTHHHAGYVIHLWTILAQALTIKINMFYSHLFKIVME